MSCRPGPGVSASSSRYAGVHSAGRQLSRLARRARSVASARRRSKGIDRIDRLQRAGAGEVTSLTTWQIAFPTTGGGDSPFPRVDPYVTVFLTMRVSGG